MLRLTLHDHANVDVRVVCVTERLLLVEVWWGRTVSSELLVDAWRADFVHATSYAWYGAVDGDEASPRATWRALPTATTVVNARPPGSAARCGRRP